MLQTAYLFAKSGYLYFFPDEAFYRKKKEKYLYDVLLRVENAWYLYFSQFFNNVTGLHSAFSANIFMTVVLMSFFLRRTDYTNLSMLLD